MIEVDIKNHDLKILFTHLPKLKLFKPTEKFRMGDEYLKEQFLSINISQTQDFAQVILYENLIHPFIKK